MLGFPLLASWLYPYVLHGYQLPVGKSFTENLLFLALNKLDSGGQMALGPHVIRMLLLLTGVVVLAVPRLIPPEWKKPLGALMLFHGVSLISALNSSHPLDAAWCAVDAFLVTLMVWVPSTLWTSQDVPRVARLFVAIGFLTVPTDYYQMSLAAATDGQMRGSFFHPNMMASYLLLGIPSALVIALFPLRATALARPVAVRMGFFYVFMTAAVLACVVLSSSRAGMIAGVLALALVVPGRFDFRSLGVVAAGLLALRLTRSLWVAGLVVLAGLIWLNRGLAVRLLILMALMLGFVYTAKHVAAINAPTAPIESRLQSMASGADNSLSSRLAFWKAAVSMARDYPVLGVGPEGFHRYYPQYQTDLRWFSKFPHSIPLAVLCETGFLGFAAFCVAAFLVLRLAWERLRSDGDEAVRLNRLALLAGCAAFAVCSLFDVQFQFPVLPLSFGFCLGLALVGDASQDDSFDEPEAERWTVRPGIILQQSLAGVLMLAWGLSMTGLVAEYYIQVARIASQRGRHAEGAVLAREAAHLSPFMGEYYHQLGMELLADAQKLNDEQKKMLDWAADQAIRYDSHRAVHYDLKAKACVLLRGSGEAIPYLVRALECDPMNYASFYLNLAHAHAAVKRTDTVRDLLHAALVRFPPDAFGVMFDFRSSALRTQLADIYSLLAELEDPSKNPKAAERYYLKALELNAEAFWVRLGLAVSLYEQKRLAEAIPHLEKAYQLDPASEPALRLLIYCLDQTGDKARAQSLIKGVQKK